MSPSPAEPTDRQLLLSIDRRVGQIEELLMRRPIPKNHDHRHLWVALVGIAAAILSSPLWMHS